MPPPSSPVRNASLDALRVLSLLGIVSLHVANGGFHGMKPVGFVVDELSRFAVPVFFILSAYFWKPEELASPLALTRKVAWRVLLPFVLWEAITIAWKMIDRPNFTLDLSLNGLVFLVWSAEPAYHLWFLPALVLGAALVATSCRYFGWRFTLALAAFLFVLGTTMGSYGRLLSGHTLPFWADRNGLFFAPIFLIAGILLRRYAGHAAQLPALAVGAAVALFAVLQLAEGYFIVGRYPMGHDYSIATLGYGVAVAMLFTRLELRGAWWSLLGRATFTAYLVHVLVIEVIVEHFSTYSPLVIALTFAASLAIGAAWQFARAAMRTKAAATVGQPGSS